MRPSQPVADTFTLLAGGHIKGAPRLGEERTMVECTVEYAPASRLGGRMLRLGGLLRALIVSLTSVRDKLLVDPSASAPLL
jgi:hypothetical protein